MTYDKAKNLIINWSQDLNLETLIYYTDKGWYLEGTNGWYEGIFVSNTIKSAYPYSLHNSQIKPTNNSRSWANVLWAGHPHPKNTNPSEADRIFSKYIKRPFYTWGWAGDDYIITGKYYQTVEMYLKYGFVPENVYE